MTRSAIALAIALSIGACHRPTPVTTCTDDLSGVWRSEAGARWMILDSGAALEAYPLFDDTRPANAPTDLEIGARVIDLARTDGEVKRRYLRAGDECLAPAPAHLVTCRDDTLEIVLADPAPPISFAPCRAGRPEPSHRERWRREAP